MSVIVFAAEIVALFYCITIIPFSIFVHFLIYIYRRKTLETFDDLGIDRILLLNPFFFPVKRVKEIIARDEFQEKIKCLPAISFYKLYFWRHCLRFLHIFYL